MPRFSLSNTRLSAWKLIALGGFLTFLLTLYTLHPSSSSLLPSSLTDVFSRPPIQTTPCPPRLWASGQWEPISPRAPSSANVSSPADVLALDGFQGCASDREYKWHLAAEEDQFDRFPDVVSYVWTPPETCDVRSLEGRGREQLVKELVEDGGWLLIGDSVTENHFFSLSCLLYPHVIATPNYTLNPYWDRAWPQNLYLNPDSPLVPYLKPPAGFNMSITPLVTFRRVDLMLTQEQLTDVYHSLHPEQAQNEQFQLFGGDQVWELPPSEYLSLFTAPLPEANYGTLITSTAGHWTVGTIPGLKNDNLPGSGIQNVIDFFEDAMQVWAGMIQGWMDGEAKTGNGGKTAGGKMRQVVVRAYLPGHDGCHYIMHPWRTYEQENMKLPYNWGSIGTFNGIFENILSAPQYKNVHYLPIDRPALLRPDAHAGGDCLHLISGSGVIEGWTQYIWHYVTRELDTLAQP
ncbi:hypothetical protein EW026_g6840 [Hermanssonia centrifuga]|uniref:Uncharacterized protein n=1 Tax=Hermanssonia centrifuga TaxID=98765 RepID=A0A4S4K9S1_9APHY|nr:hypothetical protein EW026_g6840 [Hermanssonia centrifuga]